MRAECLGPSADGKESQIPQTTAAQRAKGKCGRPTARTIRSDNWRNFRAKCLFQCGDPAGIRTQVSDFTGRCSTTEQQNQRCGPPMLLSSHSPSALPLRHPVQRPQQPPRSVQSQVRLPALAASLQAAGALGLSQLAAAQQLLEVPPAATRQRRLQGARQPRRAPMPARSLAAHRVLVSRSSVPAAGGNLRSSASNTPSDTAAASCSIHRGRSPG